MLVSFFGYGNRNQAFGWMFSFWRKKWGRTLKLKFPFIWSGAIKPYIIFMHFSNDKSELLYAQYMRESIHLKPCTWESIYKYKYSAKSLNSFISTVTIVDWRLSPIKTTQTAVVVLKMHSLATFKDLIILKT